MAVGLAVESGWLFVLLKIAAALLGFFLLARGHRLPRFTGGLFWLLVSLASPARGWPGPATCWPPWPPSSSSTAGFGCRTGCRA